MAKKELNSKMSAQLAKVITSMSDINAINATVNGEVLPVGQKFQFICVGDVKKTERIPAYQAIIIELESGVQISVSFNTLKGVKRVAVVGENEKPFNRIETVDTHFTKSGKNIIDYINDNSETVFAVSSRDKYQTVVYGSDRITDKYLPIFTPEKAK